MTTFLVRYLSSLLHPFRLDFKTRYISLCNLICSLQSWDAFFRNATNGAQPGAAYTSPPNLAPYNKNEVPLTALVPASGGMPSISSGLSYTHELKLIEP